MVNRCLAISVSLARRGNPRPQYSQFHTRTSGRVLTILDSFRRSIHGGRSRLLMVFLPNWPTALNAHPPGRHELMTFADANALATGSVDSGRYLFCSFCMEMFRGILLVFKFPRYDGPTSGSAVERDKNVE